MLLTLSLRRPLVIAGIAIGASTMSAGCTQLRAQSTGSAPSERSDSLRRVGPRQLEPTVTATAHAPGAWSGIGCSLPACADVARHATGHQDQPARVDQRGRFALIGLLVGAAAGWGVYAYQCSHDSDCYSPVGGILLAAAGGTVGLLIGVLIAPGPGSS